jgi:aldehyde dehydrogenase
MIAPAATEPVEASNLIGGEWQTAGGVDPVWNPADVDELVGTVPRSTPDDAEQALDAARRAFRPWARQSLQERGEVLRRAADTVLESRDARAVLLVRESGKVVAEAQGEILAASNVLRYYADLSETFEVVEPLPSPNGRVLVAREPMGVSVVIVPWNAPMLLGMLSVAPALLAGNTVVVKPSGDAPLALIDFLRVLDRQLPPGVLNIVSGGPDIGRALVVHPLTRRVMFTGSVPVGRTVAADAMASLKRVSLELGGNDPAVVLDDADLDGDVVPELVKAVYPTSGQVCYAVKRIYVQNRLFDEFVERFTAASDELVVGHGLDPRSDMGPLINHRQLAFVESLVADARDRGAVVTTVGSKLEPAAWGRGHFHLPTVITDVDHSAKVVACEQFGPAIPIMPFDSIDEAIGLANDSEYGLAASIWTGDEERGFRLAREIEAGTTFVNTHRPGSSGVDMPFGGFKESGLGRGHGVVALEEQFELHTVSSRRPAARPAENRGGPGS